jgi:chromosomal replication initiation ATPase DnaA
MARKLSGMSLCEIGRVAGGMEYGAVSEAVRRMERRLVTDKQLRNTQRKIMTDMLNIET